MEDEKVLWWLLYLELMNNETTSTMFLLGQRPYLCSVENGST